VLARLGLNGPQTVLELGSGVGRWSRCVAELLPQGSTLLGIDREPRWVDEARVHADDQ
jgi:predicted O-methyltransferase YrrM